MTTVQKKREEKGWSQTKLSMKSGVAQTTISAIETGKVNPTVKLLKKIAAAIGCRVGDLIDDESSSIAESKDPPPITGKMLLAADKSTSPGLMLELMKRHRQELAEQAKQEERTESK